MGLKEDFEEYTQKAKTLPAGTSNDNKLALYGLYKQATVGPVNTDRPGMFSMAERAKWDAWKAVEESVNTLVDGENVGDITFTKLNALIGKSKEEAMSDYITKVKKLLEESKA